MIFLAVSAIIFVGAQLTFQGQQGKTQFEQGMRDASSKLQQYVGQVGTTLFNGGDRYDCSVSATTGRAALTASSGSQVGGSQDCIFLGDAFQVVPGKSDMYIYTILGNRSVTISSSQTEPATTLSQAMPEPAFASASGTSDTYAFNWATVLSSKITTTGGTTSDSDLVGFYNSLQQGYSGSGSSNGQSIIGKGYGFTSNDTGSYESAAVQSCIEEKNANGFDCSNTPQISQWQICFQSTGSSQTALLTATASPAGITTDVNFTSCS
jgi:hypothetical protein